MAIRVVHHYSCPSPFLCNCLASQGYPRLEDDGMGYKCGRCGGHLMFDNSICECHSHEVEYGEVPEEPMMEDVVVVRVLKHIAAFRTRKSVRLLETIYGPRALPLRTQVAALMLDRKVTGSDKAAQYGNLRRALLEMVGATGDCIAAQDADFESRAEALIAD